MRLSSRSPSAAGVAKPVGEVRFGDLRRRLAAGPPPRLDPAVEDVQPVGRISIQAQQPVATDRLPVHPDVVVEDDPVALAHAPPPQQSRDLVGRWHEPFPLDIACLGRRAPEGQLLVQVAVCGARDVSLVVDPPIGRDVDEPEIRVGDVLGEPGSGHGRPGIGRTGAVVPVARSFVLGGTPRC